MKTNLSIEEKKKIAARLFYQDNCDPDDKNSYESFQEACVDFMGSQAPSDDFVEFTVGNIIKETPGHVLFFRNDDGHVISVRESDGFLGPVTEITNEDGWGIQEAFTEVADKYPELDGMDLVEKMGWKRIEFSA